MKWVKNSEFVITYFQTQLDYYKKIYTHVHISQFITLLENKGFLYCNK